MVPSALGFSATTLEKAVANKPALGKENINPKLKPRVKAKRR